MMQPCPLTSFIDQSGWGANSRSSPKQWRTNAFFHRARALTRGEGKRLRRTSRRDLSKYAALDQWHVKRDVLVWELSACAGSRVWCVGEVIPEPSGDVERRKGALYMRHRCIQILCIRERKSYQTAPCSARGGKAVPLGQVNTAPAEGETASAGRVAEKHPLGRCSLGKTPSFRKRNRKEEPRAIRTTEAVERTRNSRKITHSLLMHSLRLVQPGYLRATSHDRGIN